MLVRRRSIAHRPSSMSVWVLAISTVTPATAGTTSLLAILIAIVSVFGAAVERYPTEDSAGWAELDETLPREATLEQAIGKIRRARIVISEFIGYSGQSSSVYAAFLRLRHLASDEQLRALVSDPSPAVRVYAFYALTNRHSESVAYNLLLSRLGDDARVRTQQGCIGGESTVFDAMLERIADRLSTSQRDNLLELGKRSNPPTAAKRFTGFLGRKP